MEENKHYFSLHSNRFSLENCNRSIFGGKIHSSTINSETRHHFFLINHLRWILWVIYWFHLISVFLNMKNDLQYDKPKMKYNFLFREKCSSIFYFHEFFPVELSSINHIYVSNRNFRYKKIIILKLLKTNRKTINVGNEIKGFL